MADTEVKLLLIWEGTARSWCENQQLFAFSVGAEVLDIFGDPIFHQYFVTYKCRFIGFFFVFESLLLIHFSIFGGIKGGNVSMPVLHVTFSIALENKNANNVTHKIG